MTIEKVTRSWGYYLALGKGYYQDQEYVMKELVVYPKHRLSMQKHRFRTEDWWVNSGVGFLILEDQPVFLSKDAHVFIERNSWHQLINSSDSENLVILELQRGLCDEADIERKSGIRS